MKQVYNFLNIVIWSFVGVFFGSSAYTFWHYKTYPELYAMQSAPWYLAIQIRAVVTVVVVAALLLARWAIRRRMK